MFQKKSAFPKKFQDPREVIDHKCVKYACNMGTEQENEGFTFYWNKKQIFENK